MVSGSRSAGRYAIRAARTSTALNGSRGSDASPRRALPKLGRWPNRSTGQASSAPSRWLLAAAFAPAMPSRLRPEVAAGSAGSAVCGTGASRRSSGWATEPVLLRKRAPFRAVFGGNHRIIGLQPVTRAILVRGQPVLAQMPLERGVGFPVDHADDAAGGRERLARAHRRRALRRCRLGSGFDGHARQSAEGCVHRREKRRHVIARHPRVRIGEPGHRQFSGKRDHFGVFGHARSIHCERISYIFHGPVHKP